MTCPFIVESPFQNRAEETVGAASGTLEQSL